MLNHKKRMLREFIVKHSKIAFPIVLVVAVAITVALAMGIDKVEEQMEESMPTEEVPEVLETETVVSAEETPDVELIPNDDGAMYTLMAIYYNALANGDVETIESISNYVEDTEGIRIKELSKYIESYPQIDIYTKVGPVEGSYIAYVYTHVTFYGYEQRIPGLMTFYVCTDEAGNYYLNESETAEEVLEYVRQVSLQDDVVELANKTNTEYNELLRSNLKLAEYVNALEQEVSQATGEALAAKIAAEEALKKAEEANTGNAEQEVAEVVYAVATDTVNVRNSDSQQAEKLGQLAAGGKVQVLEQKANGWSRVLFEGREGYIKSEYLLMEGAAGSAEAGNQETSSPEVSAPAVTTGRTAIAESNLNLRKEASSSSAKLGVVSGGDKVEVLSEANGWSQIRYNGQVGYVKTEYLQ